MPFIISPNTLSTDSYKLNRKWGQSPSAAKSQWVVRQWSSLKPNYFSSNSGTIWLWHCELKKDGAIDKVLSKVERCKLRDYNSVCYPEVRSIKHFVNFEEGSKKKKKFKYPVICYWELLDGVWKNPVGPKIPLTSGAEWTIVCRVSAVAWVSIILLHTLPSVPAVHPKTGTVALASGLDPRSDLCSLFQVKGNAVHP